MADKVSYPQIPSTVWWGVRSLLKYSPKMTIDEQTLGVELDVQAAAARQYLSDLKRVGILSETNKPTDLADKWRQDETYAEAVKTLLSNVYPEGLVHLAPPESADRQKIISWFTREGLGIGTAGNKAATYLLLCSPNPNEAPSRGASTLQKSPSRTTSTTEKKGKGSKSISTSVVAPQPPNDTTQRTRQTESIPLNINVQIHISADASGEQIESIFSAMRRYLYDSPSN